MILLFCGLCKDIFKVNSLHRRQCYCGNACGIIENDLCVFDGKDATPIYIEDGHLERAASIQPSHGITEQFRAFIMPIYHPTLKRIEGNDEQSIEER